MRHTHRKHLCTCLVALVLVMPACAQERKTTEMVPVRDGTLLATDIYLPEGDGPWPAVVIRTPYGRYVVRGDHLGVPHGYATVIQDFRGRLDSEGDCMVFRDDAWGENADGYDTIEWVAEQPWCNGKVGTWGGSALGITQYMTAPTDPPSLLCQYVGIATPSLYHRAVYQGGAYRQALVDGWLSGNGFPEENRELMLEHNTFDDWWEDFTLRGDVFERVTVPAVHDGGWFDVFCQGTLDGFIGYQTLGGEGARGKQKLLIGPWTHGTASRREQGELVFPENATQPPPHADVWRWLEYWLKGEDNGIMDEPAVTYYVMGDVDDPEAPGNEWRTAETWPIPANEMPAFLRADGTLSLGAPTEEEPLSYAYDPADPVPTLGGCNLLIPSGPMDQREVENRADVLLFTSPVLEEPIEITGPIKASLFVSSDCPDTDFTAKLTDVYPDGRSMLICDGIIRCRFREGFDREALMEEGEVYEVEVDLWSTSIVINTGHQLRLAISSSNAPRFGPNPNTADGDGGQVATNTIHISPEHPSAVILPLIQ